MARFASHLWSFRVCWHWPLEGDARRAEHHPECAYSQADRADRYAGTGSFSSLREPPELGRRGEAGGAEDWRLHGRRDGTPPRIGAEEPPGLGGVHGNVPAVFSSGLQSTWPGSAGRPSWSRQPSRTSRRASTRATSPPRCVPMRSAAPWTLSKPSLAFPLSTRLPSRTWRPNAQRAGSQSTLRTGGWSSRATAAC